MKRRRGQSIGDRILGRVPVEWLALALFEVVCCRELGLDRGKAHRAVLSLEARRKIERGYIRGGELVGIDEGGVLSIRRRPRPSALEQQRWAS